MNTLTDDLPPELSRPRVRPGDRLGFTILIAALVHLAILLGVGFTYVKPEQISQTLEITLATFKSESKPKQADFPPSTLSKAAVRWKRKRCSRPPKSRRTRTPRSTRSRRRPLQNR